MGKLGWATLIGGLPLFILACAHAGALPEGTTVTSPTSSSSARASTSASPPPVPEDAFSFHDDNLSARIYLPRQTTCVLFSALPTRGTKCAIPPGASTEQLTNQGGLLALVSSDSSGKLMFTAQLNEDKLGVAKDRRELARGIQNASRGNLVENEERSRSIPLSTSIMQRVSLDTKTPEADLGIPGDTRQARDIHPDLGREIPYAPRRPKRAPTGRLRSCVALPGRGPNRVR